MNNWEKRFELFRCDCIERMRVMVDNSVDFTLTDIPYDAVNRKSNGLRNLDKGAADECAFDLIEFLDGVYRVTKNSICIFCGSERTQSCMTLLLAVENGLTETESNFG